MNEIPFGSRSGKAAQIRHNTTAQVDEYAMPVSTEIGKAIPNIKAGSDVLWIFGDLKNMINGMRKVEIEIGKAMYVVFSSVNTNTLEGFAATNNCSNAPKPHCRSKLLLGPGWLFSFGFFS